MAEREMGNTIDDAIDKEMGRWQEAIRDSLCGHFPSENIDGSGCDSGDPLDLTLAEIEQAVCCAKDRIDELQTERDRLQSTVAALERERDELRNYKEAIVSRKQYVKCNHPDELVIHSENGYICVECWAEEERARADALVRQVEELKVDKARLDFIESHAKGYGGWVFRESNLGRGMRLHESRRIPNYPTAREAIDAALAALAEPK